ncbi:hypothetical protein IFM89_024501 [Coptis chinensis]|uniref:Protein FAR1-RELATED SEQUENCE n=1 Tax=Coptis chinensis TaxID=261450 RepID=A0A835H6B0_9MAGN|nr:hypothetical protein IFM89_024501 [Coptis chinensis]
MEQEISEFDNISVEMHENEGINISIEMNEDEGINDKELEDTIDVDVGMENEFAQEEKVGDPEIGMVFDTAEGLFEYYTKYGSENGFPIKKRSSSKGDDGVVRWVLFTCLDQARQRALQEMLSNCIQLQKPNGLNNELKKGEGACESSQPTTCGSAGRPPFKAEDKQAGTKLLKVARKEEERGKREQVVKMNQGKKKGMSTTENTMNDLDLEKDPIGGSEVMESGETQESIALKDTIGGA